MARATKQRSATIRFGIIATMVARMVAVLALVPALLINVDWAAGILYPWNIAAVGSIVFSAVFIEAALHSPSWVRTPIFLAVATLLFVCNCQVAFDNASVRSDHRSDHRRTAIVAAKTASSQRSQWSQGRKEAATVAGEASPASIESDIQAMIAKDSKRWQSTEECDPLNITAGPSRDFCSAIGNLKSKKAAAEKRDELDAKIGTLDTKAEGEEVITSANPFADNVASLLGLFGVKVSEDMKTAITAQRDVLRALTLELVATFGPSAWLFMVSGLMRTASRLPAPVPAPQARPAPAKTRDPEPAKTEEPAPVVALDDPFHRFVAECIEEAPGINIPAGDPWQAWLLWCAKNDAKGGSQKAFGGKMKHRFAWEPNNNRPRYLNIRVRSAKPALRVVQ